MTIIDGKATAAQIKQEIAAQVRQMTQAGARAPHLAAVLVGHDGGSEIYVRNKVKACQECGIKSTVLRFESDVTEQQLLDTVHQLNGDKEVDGFIVQLPLPEHIDEQKIIQAIDPSKDVDGFTPVNVGRLSLGLPCFRSATPQGILTLLERYHIETAGKHCVVLGRSNIVGKPVATMMLQKAYPGNCTVTVCHSATRDLASITRQADILIVAIGQPEFVKADMVKPGAVVIDVGTTRLPSTLTKSGWKLHGDVDFEHVAPLCSFITPVPGGVGPMTICSLLQNTLKARKLGN